MCASRRARERDWHAICSGPFLVRCTREWSARGLEPDLQHFQSRGGDPHMAAKKKAAKKKGTKKKAAKKKK
jgi:hypothetical protein